MMVDGDFSKRVTFHPHQPATAVKWDEKRLSDIISVSDNHTYCIYLRVQMHDFT